MKQVASLSKEKRRGKGIIVVRKKRIKKKGKVKIKRVVYYLSTDGNRRYNMRQG